MVLSVAKSCGTVSSRNVLILRENKHQKAGERQRWKCGAKNRKCSSCDIIRTFHSIFENTLVTIIIITILAAPYGFTRFYF